MHGEAALNRIRRFTRGLAHVMKPVDEALPQLRDVLRSVSARYCIVGGVAVVHHGYLRTTEDLDVLIEADSLERARLAASGHGFDVQVPHRWLHRVSGVPVDFLVAGGPAPRAGDLPYPTFDELGPTSEGDVIALSGLLRLKLTARRHQDLADVVALIKRLEDAEYLRHEAALPAPLRPALARLRDDALEELRFER